LGMKTYAGLLRPVLTQAPFEVSVVGDVDETKVTTLMAQTLGALPPRRASVRQRPDAWFLRVGATDLPTLRAYHQGPATKAAVGAIWPLYVAEPSRRPEEVAIMILGRVFEDALNHRLREDLGLTYGPNVTVKTPDFGDQGLLEVVVETTPADTDKVAAEIQAVANALAAGQVSDAEVETARRPLAALQDKAMRGNAYWAAALVAAPNLKDRTDEIVQVPALLASVTPTDVRKAAADWLKRKPLVILVDPTSAATVTTAAVP